MLALTVPLVALEKALMHLAVGGNEAPEALHLAVSQLTLIDIAVVDRETPDTVDAALSI